MKRLIVRFSDDSGFSYPIPEEYQFGYDCFDFAKTAITTYIDNWYATHPDKLGELTCTYLAFHYGNKTV